MRSAPPLPFLVDREKTSDYWAGPMMQDDHVPFLKRGVEVLHIIPSPFPKVWHRMEDDGEHLDPDSVEDWARILTAFVGEWMDLEGYFPKPQQATNGQKGRDYPRKTEL